MAPQDSGPIKVASADSEDIFFRRQEEDKIKALRERAEKEANQKYCQEHRYHCFRCGTRSLVEVSHGAIKIDVCVNEGCGAVHLDPGELDLIVKDQTPLKKIQSAVLGIFKK